MTGEGQDDRAERIREHYGQILGSVPAGIADRIAAAGATGRIEAIIDAAR